MTDQPQLKMVWPTTCDHQRLHVAAPAGYQLRLAEKSDEQAFLELMARCGWEFDSSRLEYCYSRLLPSGWFVVIDRSTSILVASAMSLHNYTGRSTYSGTLGWVGCDPKHRGKKLGSVVSAAVTSRLIEAGYREIELYTEHFREAAIVSYLRLGFVPYLYNEAATRVWEDVCRQIGHPFTRNQWPSGSNAYPAT